VGGDLYQDKPPLYFWLLAICYTLFGSVKASFLIPSFLAAGGTLFLIYDFGRRTVSREAGLAAALISVCTLQFVMVMRGAQIDATLCFVTTFSLYALLRHLLLGPAWGWYFIGGFLAGVGIFTKGVGFLPVLLLIPYFTLRALRWKNLPAIDAGKAGWRWWLAPLALLIGVSLWFVPMLITVATSEAVATLISGTTTTIRSCVSRARSALPSISTAALTPFICRLLVKAMPCSMVTSPRTKSNEKPSLNTSRKSSTRRRGSDCRLSTPSSLARPGSAFRNWPFSTETLKAPVRLG
jgi:hypothetical protein